MADAPVALPKDEGMPLDALVSARGHVALTMSKGSVHLRGLPGVKTPTIVPVPGKAAAVGTFTPSGSHLVVLRDGVVWSYDLPR